MRRCRPSDGLVRSALAGVLPQPAKGRIAGMQDRDVTVVRAQPQLRRRGLAGQPPAVRAGHHPILAAVYEQHRRAYRPGVEPPGGDAGQFVVHHPAQSAVHGLLDNGVQPGPWAGQGGMVGGGEQGLGRRAFSVKGSVRLIDKFRDDVHARVTEGDDMTDEQARQLNAIFQGLTVQGTSSPEETINELFSRIKRIEAALIVPGTNSAEDAFNLLFKRIREIHHKIVEEP
jgi:hypothetical protein